MKKILKSVLLKREKRKLRKEIRLKDKAWKESILKRDSNTCQICKKQFGNRGMATHHILPREFKELRWDIMNGLTLCSSHHHWNKFSAHQNSLWFSLWLQKNKPLQFEYLEKSIDLI